MKSSYRNKIKGKTILITGGTGSFGNHVIQKLISLNPNKIIIFSRDEKKQFDMRNKFNSPLLRFVIGDVRDGESVNSVMEGVDYIFHAAALKQVPTCEFFPMEAIKTNVLGAANVIESAIQHNVKKVVLLSTDKAVYPINAMGMSKALMEKIMFATSRNGLGHRHKTVVCAVRYGNVLYSRGSVVPYFVELMKKNKKLSVTNLNMTRFILPLEEAVDLVLFALTEGKNGHIYVKNSPAATMETTVKSLCKIFSYKKGYEEVGIRAGEKMHETLITKEEMLRVIKSGSYFIIPPESYDLDYNKYFFKGKKVDTDKVDAFTSENTKILNIEQTLTCLLSLPEIKEEARIIKSKV